MKLKFGGELGSFVFTFVSDLETLIIRHQLKSNKKVLISTTGIFL